MNPRASRSALMVASVPEETMRTMSIDGTASTTAFAMRTSSSVGAPKLVPRPSCARTASSTTSGAWPRIIGPQDITKSM